MSATISLEDLEKFSENVYEAIIVIAKRARQINQEQKRMVEEIVGLDDMEGSEEDEDYLNDEEERNYITLPKPTRLAMEEFLQGKIKYEFLKNAE
ncbi:MAG: DNA-directed RNA polymerase subunit omega [Calditrichaeota bacterium]|nr:DNA-directed RNA polymerase subunit omega [Calditrichota bacterium]